MTKDEIIALAKEAGVLDVHSANGYMCSQSELFLFTSATQAKERERCARVCEDLQDMWLMVPAPTRPGYACAEAIRSFG